MSRLHVNAPAEREGSLTGVVNETDYLGLHLAHDRAQSIGVQGARNVTLPPTDSTGRESESGLCGRAAPPSPPPWAWSPRSAVPRPDESL